MLDESSVTQRDDQLFLMKTSSPQETFSIGQRLAGLLQPGMVVALIGDLGAGKTQVAKGIAQGLNVQTYVDSPAFDIIHEYQGDLRLYHMDFYRLDALAPEDYYWLEEYLYGNAICVIEWANLFLEQLLHEYLRIEIATGMEENTRLIRLSGLGARYKLIADRMRSL
jgi:tRNA threonylcarbamoyladenosine biosynthesis protein TsaE